MFWVPCIMLSLFTFMIHVYTMRGNRQKAGEVSRCVETTEFGRKLTLSLKNFKIYKSCRVLNHSFHNWEHGYSTTVTQGSTFLRKKVRSVAPSLCVFDSCDTPQPLLILACTDFYLHCIYLRKSAVLAIAICPPYLLWTLIVVFSLLQLLRK